MGKTVVDAVVSLDGLIADDLDAVACSSASTTIMIAEKAAGLIRGLPPLPTAAAAGPRRAHR